MEPVAVFFDTSALVKRYVLEQGSRYVAHFFAISPQPAVAFVSALTYVEMIAALSRRLPLLPATVYATFLTDYRQGMEKIPVDSAILERGAALARSHRLRAADAIQLASALRVADTAPDVLVMTADAEMIVAAQVMGLHVSNPNQYE